MSQAKDRTLFTITKAHQPCWELDHIFRAERRELNLRDPRIPIRRRVTRVAPSPPPFFAHERSSIGIPTSTSSAGNSITSDSFSDDDNAGNTPHTRGIGVSARTTTRSRTVRFRDHFLNSVQDNGTSSDEEDDLLRMN